MTGSSPSLFSSTRLSLLAVVLLLFGLGLVVRFYDLTDLPLDFHPTRQLLSGLKARGMYYQANQQLPEWQRKMAVQQWKLRAEVEPEVFERVVAFTYRFTGEYLWVARVYSSIFWMMGGAFLFLLVRDLISADAAVLSAAYFFFLPYAVKASRSFQPDILMIMLTVCFWWLVLRWSRTESWGWAIAAGLIGGLAIYVKFVAAFFVVGAAVAAASAAFGGSWLRKPQVWLMAALGILPAGIYIFYGTVLHGFLGRQFGGRFIPGLLLSPLNYLQWATMANAAAGGLAIMLGLLGLLLARQRSFKIFAAGLWIAYLLFGLFFDYHIATHDYYHLPLIAIVAVSIGPIADAALHYVAGITGRVWMRVAALSILAYGLLATAWEARAEMRAIDYRPQAAMWAEIGDELQHGPNVVALTQDYGTRLAYWGWQNAIIWPNSGDTDYHEARGGSIQFDELFSKLAAGNAYFVVTDFAELDRQPQLQDRLADYAVFARGAGYVIYNLQKPVTQ